MRMPGGEHGGQTIDALVQPRDLLPTLLDALGIDGNLVLPFRAPRATTQLFPQDMVTDTRNVALHGESVLPVIRGESGALRDFAFTGHHAQQWAVRNHIWTVLININEKAGRLGSPYELYERRNDPGEHDDRAEDLPEVVDMFELAIRRYVGHLR
jgi:arylsulfatase A-like enzyme